MVSRWIDRWFGDGCPGWTWPALSLAIALAVLTATLLLPDPI